jgi:predicted Zn-dependent protease
VLPQAFKAHNEFISTNKVIRNTPASNQIQDVGKLITQAAEAYFKYKQNPNYLDDYAWEYNLVEDKAINAWCMPGGKIVFYTGIMDVAKTEAGIAAIMGHEVAHALANHGAQRMSAGTIQQGLGILGAKLLENEPEKKEGSFSKSLWNRI